MDEVRPDLLAATLDRCLTVPAAMGILAGTRSGKRSSSRMTWAIPRLGEGSLSRDLSFQAKGVGVYVTGEAIRSR
jgi:hypothetical protein